jgi:hypothetical protein
LERHLKSLDELHTRKSQFALRYAVADEDTAPAPQLMIIAPMASTRELIIEAIDRWQTEDPDSEVLNLFKLKFSQSAYMRFNPVALLILDMIPKPHH